MSLFIDQLKREIELNSVPKKIVSLVPSQTELLHDLGLDEEVIGITKFCIHPEKWFHEKERVGGTKTIATEKIKSLKPDLIIANKEENVQEQIEKLAEDFPVWVSDVNTLTDAFEMINGVGKLVEKTGEAQTLSSNIKNAFSQLQTPTPKLHTAYLIWKKPYMTVGGDTFINDMLTQAGFENIYKNKHRYPEISIEDLRTSHCELLMLSSEPYPFQQKHVDELQGQLPRTKIIVVNGEMFSWYGSRLLKAPGYFNSLQMQLTSTP